MLGTDWRNGTGTTADRLAEALRSSISSGVVLPGTTLPSQRRLSELAGVSRTTIGLAIAQLVSAGWVEQRHKARFVARLPDAIQQGVSPYEMGVDDLSSARVAAPSSDLQRAVDAASRRLAAFMMSDGVTASGLTELRTLIAGRYRLDGLETTAEQVVITNGAMGAFTAVLDATPGPVLVEDPTYHGALSHLHTRRRKVVSWQRTPRWDIDSLDNTLLTHGARIAYLVPDFHNPTGHVASADERARLAHLRSPATIVVDETLRAIHLDGEPPPRIATFAGSVVTIDSLSKTIWSGLRIGWVRLPVTPTRDQLAIAASTNPAPILDQLVAIELWPHLESIAAARRELLGQNRDVMVDLLRGAGFKLTTPPGGLVCWIDLERPVAAAVSTRLRQQGLPAASGARFSPSRAYTHHIRVPFTVDGDTAGRIVDALTNAVGAETQPALDDPASRCARM